MTKHSSLRYIILPLVASVAFGCAAGTAPARAPANSDLHQITLNGRVVRTLARSVLGLIEVDRFVRRPKAISVVPRRAVLIVVDGGVLDGPQALENIPLYDVLSIDLLRGAEAVHRYGLRAEAGAIVVRTRLARERRTPAALSGM